MLKNRHVSRLSQIVVKSNAARRAARLAKSSAPVVAGLVGCGLSAHAGPINNMLSGIGTDITTGMRVIGVGMLGWTGLRIWMDEHHSVNPGRIVGGVTGGLFAFSPTSLQNWMSGW